MEQLAQKLCKRDRPGGFHDFLDAIAEACPPRFTVTSWDKKAGTGNFPCPKCGGTVSMTLAQGLPFNSGQMSFLAIAHKPAKCKKCGREYVPYVTGGNLQCAIAEIQPESPIALPFSGLSS